MARLEPPASHHLKAAQGWLELGNHLEANEELEHITPQLRAHPDVLEVRWHIYAKAKKWDACVDIAGAIIKLDPERADAWIHRSFALHELKRTQEALATRCQLKGFDISRGTLSQIEAQLRCVTDDELLALSRVLKVTTDSLFPPEKRSRKSSVPRQPNRPSR